MPWLRALHFIPHMHALHHPLYSAGTDILYNPESLRSVLESNPHAKSNGDLFSTLFGPSTTRDSTAQKSLLKVLPRLYTDYVFALHKQRSSIFSGNQTRQQTRDRIRHAVLRFGDECLTYLKTIEGDALQASVWETTVNVLRVIEKEATFDLAESGPHIATMTDVGEGALRHLDRAWDGVFTIAIISLCSLKCYIMSLRITVSVGYTCTGRALLVVADTTCARCPVSSASSGAPRQGAFTL